MLLPSAFCDQSQATGNTNPSRPLLQRILTYTNSSSGSDLPTILSMRRGGAALPALDTSYTYMTATSAVPAGIQSTCRALQALLGVTPSAMHSATLKRARIPPPSSTQHSALGTLSTEYSRMRNNRTYTMPPCTPPPRGANKRTRDTYESTTLNNASNPHHETSLNHGYGYDSGYPSNSSSDNDADTESASPNPDTKHFSTPKRRQRLPGPIHIPFGLERSDFANLQDREVVAAATLTSPTSSSQSIVAESGSRTPKPLDSYSPLTETGASRGDVKDKESWTVHDDADLVTVVLEKMKLSRHDWEECATMLGAKGEGISLGKRFQWLMTEGDIGLKMGIEGRGRFEGRRVSKRQGRGDVRMMF